MNQYIPSDHPYDHTNNDTRSERPSASWRPFRVELLSPAGSRGAFIGAVNAGADAVYLGAEKFGARAYADNFTTEDLKTVLREAHLYGVRVYLTVNTLTRERELSELIQMVQELHRAGLDGVIVQDLGVVRALRDACPGLLLHASTQMSVTGRPAVRYLKRLGISRVVPARELSLNEIRRLKEEEIEIEAFIHGAMCYCYSGRCLMSSFLGGRSGNRGRCAGTCRLPYDILDSEGRRVLAPEFQKPAALYPISMKDLYVLRILPELIDAGIDSFKIEGRMKKPEYAAGVTAMYRKYIDAYYEWDQKGRPRPWQVDPEDEKKLLSLYIRQDLSSGYYHTRNGRELITMGPPGYAGADEVLLSEIREKYLGALRPIPICGRAKLVPGKPSLLTLLCPRSGNASVTVTGAVAEPAVKRPLPAGELRERLSRTGDSHFRFENPERDLEIEMEQEVFLPVSAVNELRRKAVNALEQIMTGQAAPRREDEPE